MHLAQVEQPLQQGVSLHPRAPKTSRNVVGWGGGGVTCDRLTSHSEEVATLLIDNAATPTTDWLPISPNDIMRLNHRGHDHQLTKLFDVK